MSSEVSKMNLEDVIAEIGERVSAYLDEVLQKEKIESTMSVIKMDVEVSMENEESDAP